MPTDDASAAAGRRRRDVRVRVRAAAATPCRRRSSPCRAAPAAASPTRSTGWPASSRSPSPTGRRRPSPARRAPWCSRAVRRWTASRRRAARCPPGCRAGATPATAAVVREPVSDTASHSRMPSAAMASGCSRTTPRRESSGRGVQPRGQAQLAVRRPSSGPRRRARSCHGPGGLRSPSRAIDRRCGARLGAARDGRAPRCCLRFVVPRLRVRRQPSAGVRMVNGMRMT